jgi:hypothetical protein
MASRAAAARGKAAPGGTKKFTDDNASWLKPVSKKRSLFEEEEEDDDDEGEEEDEGEESEEGEEGAYDEEDEEGEEEDEEEEDDELDFERKARATMAKLQADAAANQEELRERDLAQSSGVLPSAEEKELEAQRPPDISALRDRVKAVVEVLSDFNARREAGVPRSEYVEVLAGDVSVVYGYARRCRRCWPRAAAHPSRHPSHRLTTSCSLWQVRARARRAAPRPLLTGGGSLLH